MNYDGNNRMINSPQALGGYAYDAAGDMTNDGANAYTYDAEGRVSTACAGQVCTKYVYDAEGRRVAKGSYDAQSGAFAPSEQYILGLGGEEVTALNGDGQWLRTNAYLGGALLATYKDAALYFQFTDWLGTKRVQLANDGLPPEICRSLPYGNQLDCSGGPEVDPHHFTGKQRDAETGLDYFGARYYASNMGRFLTPDWSADPKPVPYANFEYPQTLNLYSYTGNNPLTRTDPDGHFWQELWNKMKWGVWVKNAGLEAALQQRADQARKDIGALKNLSVNGQSPAGALKGLNNQQTLNLQRAVVDYLRQQVSSDPKTMVALALVTEGAGQLEAATAAAIAEGRACAWIVKTGRSALAADITTNITAQEFGANLEAGGYVKSVAKDGVTTLYSKGEEVYSIYPKASSTGGPTANLNVGGKIITKVRLSQ